jgi:glycosyltransferase involved in cell wall biosynthesis
MITIGNLVFNPFLNDSRVWKESKSLLSNGFKVEIIAHLSKDLPARESRNGIVINRFSYLDRQKTKTNIGKILPYLVYIFKSVKHLKKFDVLHCNDLNTLPIAFLVKKIYNRNIKIVYDAHEFETGTNGLRGVKKILVKWAEKRLIKYADKIIVVSNGIANEYSKLYQIEKPTVILNAPYYIKEVFPKNIFRDELNIKLDQKIFLYQGLLSDGRGIDILINTFKSFDTDSSVIIFMGHGDMTEKIKHEAKYNRNIYFYNAVPIDVLLDYTSSADYGVSLIEDSCLSYHYCLPNKLFEYIMANIPVIVSDIPEMKDIVESNNIGVVSKINAISLKAKINSIIKLDKKIMMENCLIASKIYNWEEQEIFLIKLYKELCY